MQQQGQILSSCKQLSKNTLIIPGGARLAEVLL